MKLQSTLTALAKALSPIPERGFRAALAAARLLLAAALSLLMAGLCPANAGEPCHWKRKPNEPAPFQFDTFHGETIDFQCTFVGFSSLPFGQSSNPPIPQSSNSPRLYYQTNGMAAAWWDIPATVSTTVVTNCQPPITNYSLSATFPPSADPGADRLTVFFGAPSNAYAAAQVRFRNSPGAHPNDLDPPSVLDWQAELAAATNDLFKSFAPTITNTYTKSETDARIEELAPRTSLAPATNYTDSATNALWEYSSAELRRKADVSRMAIITNSIIVPGRIDGSDWTYGNSFAGTPTGDLVRDAALTASAADGSIYWSSQTDYTVEGEDELQLYRYAIAWYNPYTEIFRAAVWSDQSEPMPSAVADLPSSDQVDDFRSVLGLPWPESFATLDTPEPDAVDWGSFYGIGLLGTSIAYIPTQAVETVVYSRDLATATNSLAKSLAPTISNTVTKAFVEDLGIESGIQEETDPVWTAAKGGYATTGTVAQVSEAVGTIWSYVYGDSVWIAVTNYMRTVDGVSPSLQLWEVRDGETNMVYWSKEEITNVTHDLIHDCKTNLEAAVQNAVAEMPDKAWSKYQSATGNEAPDGVTIVSTPTIQLTGGGEWYLYVDVASNSVWFLKSNGLYTFGGDTNGYIRLFDDEGKATFEVRKTDSYLVDAVPSSVHFDEDGNFCVSFQSNLQPVIYTTATLDNPNFLPEGEDPNVTVTWTQSGGVYTATLEQAVKGPSLFAYAKVEVQGETVIRNKAPTDVAGGILCTDGVHKCRPVYNNGAITWEVVQ